MASSCFCVWLHAPSIHKVRHGGHACAPLFSSVRSPCLIFADPPALVMPLIGHVRHGASQKLYQLHA